MRRGAGAHQLEVSFLFLLLPFLERRIIRTRLPPVAPFLHCRFLLYQRKFVIVERGWSVWRARLCLLCNYCWHSSCRRKPSQESQQEVTLPQNTEASAPNTPTSLNTDELPLATRMPTTITQETEASKPHAPSTLDTDELPLAEKKPAAKKRSNRRKAGANEAPLKERKQQKASMFEDKSNF